MMDTMEIFNNGFGGHLRNLLLTREIVERRQRLWLPRTRGKKISRRYRRL